MPAETITRNLIVNERRTSLRLEPFFWRALEDIARREEVSLPQLVSAVERRLLATVGEVGNLHSSLRVFSAEYYWRATSERGHEMAAHGLGDPFTGTSLSAPPDRWVTAA
ncbi:MAG TPA: ribbon-helix-helix domain-containing protein [Azospirillum sp.]|nr:ribbon-helix-helix domain-containing protein [Azospirillum sp.]